ncbi:MAG: UDP-N-acetylglucosamine 2-epimerase (non-hydrolyzing) [Acidimicrobiia bacterium]|nr:UDP-N-acetylglucosamine 2-epimerase (non-hydrolyzing) [Acidimicrobiia bacterium]
MSDPGSSGPIAVVLGTRPEIIKLAKIVELLGDDAHLIHTGQHYDDNLSQSFFTEFGMRPPDTVIGIGGQSRGQLVGNATLALDELFSTLKPSAVVVQGDTNSVMAGAIAANANSIPLVHVEAGLRSFDRRMPEEHNRVVTDHLSDLCLAPTDLNVTQLKSEGIADDRVVKTGNPIVEAVGRLMPSAEERASLLEQFSVEREQFVLATIHRPENVDTPETLDVVLRALAGLNMPVLFPMHPRTRQRVEAFRLEALAEKLIVVEPIGYRDFIGLGAESLLIVSDSGGIQEEVSVYKRPAVVIRRSTERQEVEGTFVRRFEAGPELANQLAEEIGAAPRRSMELAELPSPYGDNHAPEMCVAAIRALVGGTS